MGLSVINQRILEYTERVISPSLADDYHTFLTRGKKINRNVIKALAKFVKSDNAEMVEKRLLEILSKPKDKVAIKVYPKSNPAAVKKDIEISSSSRVKKHREKIKAKGYKNLSFQLSPDIYQKLKDLKIKNQMTYSELIIFLINK